jgi:hypothetical protein
MFTVTIYRKVRNNFILRHEINSFDFVLHRDQHKRDRNRRNVDFLIRTRARYNFELVHFNRIIRIVANIATLPRRSVTWCVSHFRFSSLETSQKKATKKSIERPKTILLIISTIINYYQHGILNDPRYK